MPGCCFLFSHMPGRNPFGSDRLRTFRNSSVRFGSVRFRVRFRRRFGSVRFGRFGSLSSSFLTCWAGTRKMSLGGSRKASKPFLCGPHILYKRYIYIYICMYIYTYIHTTYNISYYILYVCIHNIYIYIYTCRRRTESAALNASQPSSSKGCLGICMHPEEAAKHELLKTDHSVDLP